MNAVNEVEIHTRQNVWHFCCYVANAKLFCLKSFAPVTGLEGSYGKIFIPVTEILAAKTEISVTGPAQGQPSLSYEQIDILTKKRMARRDLGNGASPVDWAHMKRPFSVET